MLSQHHSFGLFIWQTRKRWVSSLLYINLSCCFLPVTRVPLAYHHIVNCIRSQLAVALDSISLFVSVTLCYPLCSQEWSGVLINQQTNIQSEHVAPAQRVSLESNVSSRPVSQMSMKTSIQCNIVRTFKLNYEAKEAHNVHFYGCFNALCSPIKGNSRSFNNFKFIKREL